MSMMRAAVCCIMVLLLASAVMAGDYSDSNMGVNPQDRFYSGEMPESEIAGYAMACEPGCELVDYGVSCCQPCRRIFVNAEALLLKMDHGTRRAMPVVIDQDTGFTDLSTHDLNFDTVAGPRLGFGYILNEKAIIETSYFGLHHWDAGAVAHGDDNLSLPGDLAPATYDFSYADRMTLTYASELHNVELNYYRRWRCSPFSVLAGFRYLDLAETFNINSLDIDSGTSDYNIYARNELFGGQLGGRWQRQIGMVGIDLVGKAGIYGNAARQSTFMGDFNNSIILRNSTTYGSHAAFIGEVGLNCLLQLTRTIYVKVGYNLLWMEGIARAPEQLDFTDAAANGTTLVFGKGAFLHGISIGLEGRW